MECNPQRVLRLVLDANTTGIELGFPHDLLASPMIQLAISGGVTVGVS